MTKILIKRGTATQWTNSTTALLAGELGLDTTNNILKVGNGSTLWNSLSGLTLTSAQVSELAQDALSTAFSNGTHSNITVTYNDNANSISLATGPDVVTTTSLNNTLTNPTSGYVSIGDVGVADGVASLGPDGKIPDSEIPAGIARDTEVSTAIANLVNSAPSTLDTLNELATALGNDANFSTTITNSIADKVSKSGGDTITSSSASVKGLIIKGAASQTANIQEWQNSSGSVLSNINSSGLNEWRDSTGTYRFGLKYSADRNIIDINSTNSGLVFGWSPNYIGGYGTDAGAGNTWWFSPFTGTRVGVIIRGKDPQTANLQEWQNSAGTVIARIQSDGAFVSDYITSGIYLTSLGKIRTGSASNYGGQLEVTTTAVGNVGAIIRGSASQTANLQQWQNSSGTVLSSFSSNGRLAINTTEDAGGRALYVVQPNGGYGSVFAGVGIVPNVTIYAASGGVGLLVGGAASQTANLTEWQNNSGTVLSKVDASGNIFVGTNQVLTKEDEKNIYLTDSGTARTIGSGDAYKIIEFTNSNTIVVTIPNDASDTTFPIGSYVEVRQMGGGQITVSATSPATLVATDNQYKTRVQYSAIVLEKRASNAWYLAGDTTA